jgi:AraC-like DNA-binding protein
MYEDSMAVATELPVTFQYYSPIGPLSDLVGVIWYWRGYEAEYAKERLMPMGTVELVISLSSGRTSDSGISGPRSEYFVIERSSQDELLGIHFKPGGLFPFLRFPFGDLHNELITLDDLWGAAKAGELLCRLHEANSIEMKFRVVEKWLMHIARRPLDHHPAVSFAIREFEKDSGLASSAVIAGKVGYSQRHFIQMFRDEVGLTPKLFTRVQRFWSVIEKIHKQNSVDWADIAISFGYSDQSHFIHDFREFSGLSPTEYLSLRTDHPGHLQFRE